MKKIKITTMFIQRFFVGYQKVAWQNRIFLFCKAEGEFVRAFYPCTYPFRSSFEAPSCLRVFQLQALRRHFGQSHPKLRWSWFEKRYFWPQVESRCEGLG